MLCFFDHHHLFFFFHNHNFALVFSLHLAHFCHVSINIWIKYVSLTLILIRCWFHNAQHLARLGIFDKPLHMAIDASVLPDGSTSRLGSIIRVDCSELEASTQYKLETSINQRGEAGLVRSLVRLRIIMFPPRFVDLFSFPFPFLFIWKNECRALKELFAMFLDTQIMSLLQLMSRATPHGLLLCANFPCCFQPLQAHVSSLSCVLFFWLLFICSL